MKDRPSGPDRRSGAVEKHGGGRCACLFEAKPTSLSELDRAHQSATEELEQDVDGEVLTAAFDPTCENRSHRCPDEALGFDLVELDVLLDKHGVTFADCGDGAHNSFDRIFD